MKKCVRRELLRAVVGVSERDYAVIDTFKIFFIFIFALLFALVWIFVLPWIENSYDLYLRI